jgi:hypothetical protein
MSRTSSSSRPAKRAAKPVAVKSVAVKSGAEKPAADKPVAGKSGAAHVIRTLIAGRVNPAELFELHYLTREPSVLYLLRAIAAMPDDTRAAIEAFVALARDPKAISAQLDPRGILTLASPEAAKILVIAQYLAETDRDKGPHVLN